jgi:two-component system response regulator DevR
MSKIRLLLVEDHTVVRAGLRALFDRQSDMEVVAEAGTSAEGLARCRATRPDLVVLDLTLPGGGGLDMIATLLRQKPAPRVLVLSMHDDPAYVRSALAAGAEGYVVKTVREQDLLAAVRAVRQGQVFIDLEDEKRTASVLGQAARPGAQDGAFAIRKLSERETVRPQPQDGGHLSRPHRRQARPEDNCRFREIRSRHRSGLRGEGKG